MFLVFFAIIAGLLVATCLVSIVVTCLVSITTLSETILIVVMVLGLLLLLVLGWEEHLSKNADRVLYSEVFVVSILGTSLGAITSVSVMLGCVFLSISFVCGTVAFYYNKHIISSTAAEPETHAQAIHDWFLEGF